MVLFSKINQKLIISVSDFHCHTKGYQYQELTNSDRYDCFFFIKRILRNSWNHYHKRKLKLSNENILFAVAIRIISASVFNFFFGNNGVNENKNILKPIERGQLKS